MERIKFPHRSSFKGDNSYSQQEKATMPAHETMSCHDKHTYQISSKYL